MDLKMKFNEDVVNYDRCRPTYTQELFDEIISFAQLSPDKKAIEIGIGTGQATLPILQTGCAVTAIEIGENLAQYSREKFAEFSNFRVENIGFETFESKTQYDLIYSATAFHWIEQSVGYSKAYDLLAPGGTLALFWNHPFAACADQPLHAEIQKAYQKYRPSSKSPKAFDPKDCVKIEKALTQYGFNRVCSKCFYQERYFDAKEYIALLNTYSDHRAMEPTAKNGLEQEIFSAIEAFGGQMVIYDTMDLYLAKKPK